MRIIKRLFIFIDDIFIWLFPYKKIRYKISDYLVCMNVNKTRIKIVSENNLNNIIYIGNNQLKDCENLTNIKNFVYEDALNKIGFIDCVGLNSCQANVIKKFIIKDDVLIVYSKKFKRN